MGNKVILAGGGKLNIKVLSETNDKISKQIREVEIICKTYDKTKGNIFLDKSLNFDQGMKSLFLFYDDNKLISLISIFMPTAKEAEISAYTLPGYRRKGYFKKLLTKAIEELKKYKQLDLLFVCETQSKDGKKAINKLGGELSFTEYFMRFKGSLSDLEKQQFSQINLQEAGLKDLEDIVVLSRQVFNCDYEDAESLRTKSLKADNRTQYIAILNDELIGMGAVSFESDEASIFGLGISPQYQGRGLGKELLNLILNDLKKKNIQNVSIEVNSRNKNAFNLYLKCGFEIETSYDYYRKPLTNTKKGQAVAKVK
jgi:ribosomal protein S18 acetylase RimI-like enzyme